LRRWVSSARKDLPLSRRDLGWSVCVPFVCVPMRDLGLVGYGSNNRMMLARSSVVACVATPMSIEKSSRLYT